MHNNKTETIILCNILSSDLRKKSLLLQGICHLLEVFLKAHGLILLSLHFGRQQTMYSQNLSFLQREGHALGRKERSE